MGFEIGQIYRFPKINNDDLLEEYVDGFQNYFYLTKGVNNPKGVSFERGIHSMRSIKVCDNSTRIPAIIISSSPHKAGTDFTPWEDEFDPDYGHIRYFGDAKSNNKKAHDYPGNATLLENNILYQSHDYKDRLKAPPLIFFERTAKGYLKFQGYGIIESVELITQFNPLLSTPYFSNYVFDMCVFSMKKENEVFDWEWINKRADEKYTDEMLLDYSPKEWQKWINEGSTNLYKVRRTITSRKIIPEKDQRLPEKSKTYDILKKIYSYYTGKEHVFELLAMRVTQEVFEESGIKFYQGWVTQKSRDKGIDFVGRMDVGSQISLMKIVVLGQAKCEKLDKPTNGVHIARTVARLKRGWIGVYVTTSYFSNSVQEEILDDQYPIMLINGKCLAETVEKILYKQGISLDTFLSSIEYEYNHDNPPKNKRTEDVLSM